MIVGYDPNRVANLRWQTAQSIERLGQLHSGDPAADHALFTIRRLRRTLDIDVMGALDALTQRDPLASRDRPQHLLQQLPQQLPQQTATSGLDDARRDYWERRYGRQQTFSEHSLFDLEMFLRIEFTRQAESAGASGANTVEAAFWSGLGTQLIVEFERRSRSGGNGDADDFGEWLADLAATNPLVGIIVATGDFDDATVLAVTSAIITAEPLGVVPDTFRSSALDALLSTIAERPTVALDLLSNADIVLALFTWNDDAFHATHIADDVLADLVVNGLVVAPTLDPALVANAYEAIGIFVSLAHEAPFDAGFPSPVAGALSLVIATHAASFLDSSSSYCLFDAYDGDVTVELGERSDLVEFFAALMFDDTARAVLTAVVHDLATEAAPGGPHITPEQVSAFSVLLDEALDHANLALAESGAVLVSLIGLGTTISNFIAGQVLSRTGVGALAKFLVSLGIRRLGDAAADRVEGESIEAPDYAVLGDVLIELELLRSALGPDAALRPSATAAQLDAAREALEAVDRLIAIGPSSFAEVERALRALRRAARLVVEPPLFTRFVPRDLDPTTHPCDPDHELPASERQR